MTIQDWHFFPLSLQYVVGGSLAALFSIWFFYRNPRTWASKLFLAFGTVVALWNFFTFLHRVAPTADLSAQFFHYVRFFFGLIIPLYSLTFLNIWKERKISILILIPLLAYLLLIESQVDYQLFLTQYGWSFKSVGAEFALNSIAMIHFGYILVVIVLLGYLIRRTKNYELQRKYGVLLITFIAFQAVGVSVSNALLYQDPNTPPVGGVLYFLTFVSIAYALSMKGSRTTLEMVPAELAEKPEDAFRTFLQQLYDLMPEDKLGQKTFKFIGFLEETGLGDYAFLSDSQVWLKTGDLSSSQLVEITDKLLAYMKRIGARVEISDRLLSVLNLIYSRSEPDIVSLVKTHEGYLKKSDLAYGIGGGDLVGLLTEDESLKNIENWEACLKIYKRILLAVIGNARPLIGPDFEREMNKSAVTSSLRVTREGQVSFEAMRRRTLEIPADKRVEVIIDAFNALICWILENLYKISEKDAEEALKKFGVVLRLNRRRASELGIYDSLLTCLSTRIPQEIVQTLFLADGFSRKDVNAFSRYLRTQSNQIVGKKILLETSPTENYEVYVTAFLKEALANGERCIVFTRRNSGIYRESSELGVSHFYHLSPDTSRLSDLSKTQTVLPLYDITQILNALDNAVKNDPWVWIVFDNISDLILSVGNKTAYRFLRHSIEILASVKACSLFLFHPEAHDKADVSAVHGLFDVIISLKQGAIQSVKA